MKTNAKLTADQRIQRQIIALLRTDPLIADYLLRWPRKTVPGGTMSVNGKQMFYNEGFVDKLTDAQLRVVLQHEVLHVLLKHTLRESGYHAAEMLKSDRLSDSELHDLLNKAGDLEINDLLMRDSFCRANFPASGLLAGSGQYADHPQNQNMEVHFDILRQKHTPKTNDKPEPTDGTDDGDDGDSEQQSGQNNDDGEGEGDDDSANGDSGSDENDGSGKPGDGDSDNSAPGDGDGDSGQMSQDGFGGMGEFMPDPDVETEADAQTKSQEYDQTFLGAAMVAQQQGKLPGWAKEMVAAITAPAKLPWNVLLRRWARKTVRGGESSYSRPARRTAHRTDIVLPSKRSQSIKRCLFIVDTSLSMPVEALNAAVPEMLKIMSTWKRAELVVAQCDTRVSDEKVYKPGAGFRALTKFAHSPEWTGRGGTELSPAFELVHKYRPEVIICLTDGYLSWPEQSATRGIPALWLMTNSAMVPPWGDCVVME